MEFRTEYRPAPSSLRLTPRRNVILLGSCFSENICRRMRHSLWPAYNPAGVLFNPFSIGKVLEELSLRTDRDNWKKFLVEHDGIQHSMLLDSKFSALNVKEVLERIEKASDFISEKLKEGADIIVTFGTSWVYSLVSGDFLGESEPYIVGNCHKLPSSAFRRTFVSPDEVFRYWDSLITELRGSYPSTRFIFTVSPVRHLKDGHSGNSISKASLRLAVKLITDRYPEFTEYFPAYEILMDDLRDYRFYASDMVHPSDIAADYIFEKFLDTFVIGSDRNLLDEGRKIFTGLSHRPLITQAPDSAPAPFPCIADLLQNASKATVIENTENIPQYIRKMVERFSKLQSVWPEVLSPSEVLGK